MIWRRESWMDRAWCARVPDLPWRTDTADLPRFLVEQMAAICEACPVRRQCADYADRHEVSGGYWAGVDRSLYAERLPHRGGDAA